MPSRERLEPCPFGALSDYDKSAPGESGGVPRQVEALVAHESRHRDVVVAALAGPRGYSVDIDRRMEHCRAAADTFSKPPAQSPPAAAREMPTYRSTPLDIATSHTASFRSTLRIHGRRMPGTPARYCGMRSCAYRIGEYTYERCR